MSTFVVDRDEWRRISEHVRGSPSEPMTIKGEPGRWSIKKMTTDFVSGEQAKTTVEAVLNKSEQ